MNDTTLAIAESSIQIPGVRATRIGLVIDENLTPEAANTLFACLEHISGCANWLWGDALDFAARKWGNQHVESRYEHASDATGLAEQSLMMYRLTAGRIPMARRRENLTFTHHAEVAYGFDDTAIQDEWLDRAIAEDWSTIELRKAIRLSKQEIFEEPNPEAGKYDPLSAYLTLSGWLGQQKFEIWPDEQVDAWIEDLSHIEEFRQKLLTIKTNAQRSR